jgi:predicted aminopeptidase
MTVKDSFVKSKDLTPFHIQKIWIICYDTDMRKQTNNIGKLTGIIFILTFLLFGSGCRMGYLFHVASGQYELLNGSVPVEEGLKNDTLSEEQKTRLRLVGQIKDFGEKELGLKETENYEKVYLKSQRNPIYTVTASPKDQLSLKTWWFPIVGKMPYLGFFDLEKAKAEKAKLEKKDLDVNLGAAGAFSTLGWFKDPITLSLIEGSTYYLVETILHELTHTTLYVGGQGEFNEGFANLVGLVGAKQFLEAYYGPSHPLTIEAQNNIEDERLFSSFISTLMEGLESLYNSSISYEDKLVQREKIFSLALASFEELKGKLKTNRFIYFGRSGLNNAYLMSINLYHRHFHLFEAVYNKKGQSVKETLRYFQALAEEKGDLIERAKEMLGDPEKSMTILKRDDLILILKGMHIPT